MQSVQDLTTYSKHPQFMQVLTEIKDKARFALQDTQGRVHRAVTIIVSGGVTGHYGFECAITAMAPRCAHCDCRVIGHGIEAAGRIFCCAHCAKLEGAKNVSDRAA